MLLSRFKNQRKLLSIKEYNILETIDNNLDVINNFSITNIADISDSSTSSINRLVNKLNLTYAEFKYILINEKEKIKKFEENNNNNNSKEVKSISKIIGQTDYIYIIGVGQSKHLCNYLSEALFELKINNTTLNDSHLISSFSPKENKNELIIYISNSGNTTTILKNAYKHKNINSLLITSNDVSALSKKCTYTLVKEAFFKVQKKSNFTPNSSLLYIIDELITSIINQ